MGLFGLILVYDRGISMWLKRFFKEEYFLLVILVLTPALFAADTSDSRFGSILDAFKHSDDVTTKRKTLQKISMEPADRENDSTMLWRKELIRLALLDRSPLVIEEAAHQIQKLKMGNFNAELLVLLESAQQRFSGYAPRVQVSLIAALGAVGDSMVSLRLCEHLDRDSGSILAPDLLLALKDLKKSVATDAVKRFIARMEEQIQRMKAMNLDPIYYFNYQLYIEFGKDVLASLPGGITTM